MSPPGLTNAERKSNTATGRHPDPRRATIGQRPIAIVEMAAASGLALLPPEERDPWHTSTMGTGELIRAAAAENVSMLVLGVGGSATHDLGLGALRALGAEFTSATGDGIALPVPATWPRIARIGSALPPLPPIAIACDVTNPLLGPQGAAAVYGPQKGLLPADVTRLDHETARLALLLCTHFGQPDAMMNTPGAGAAGGIAFGLMVAARAQLVRGFEFVSDWVDLDSRLRAADMVLTGEGRWDDSSLHGKGPGAVVARARALGKPVHVFAGSIGDGLASDSSVHPITPPGVPLQRALAEARTNLAAAIRRSLPAWT